MWKGQAGAHNRYDVSEVLNYFQSTPIVVKPLTTETDIIVPVYNGVAFLPQLFDTIWRHTNAPYRLIIIDDCSPDPGVRPILEAEITRNPNMVLLCNDRNLGFIGSVNRAAEHVRNNFVLLNTDVEVPPLWLERLMAPIIKDSNIASATPFTNAGTICSFPVMNRDNELLIQSTVDRIDAAFRHAKPEKMSVELPTGVGFCMAINRAVWSRIGGFNPIFGRGYGEENDWCQRAKKAGFRNLLVPNLFVYHKHGGSFEQTEKQKLAGRNLKILHRRHPNYLKDVRRFIKLDPIAGLRAFLTMIVGRYGSAANTVLVVDHQVGGGANVYRHRLVNERIKKGESVLLCVPNLRNRLGYDLDYLSEYDKAYFSLRDLAHLIEVAGYLSISEIIVNSIVHWPAPVSTLAILKQIKHVTGARITLPVHDFYALCPSYNLLNEQGKFCDLPSVADCHRCLPQNRSARNPDGVDIETWRTQWRELISESEDVICFSESSVSLVKRVYDLRQNQVCVKPHEMKGGVTNKPRIRFDKGLHIGVVGAINHAKGAVIVSEIAKVIEMEANGTTLSVIGPFDGWLRGKYVRVTGPYVPAELPDLLTKLEINICFLPSVWPETFSYVTSELIDLDMPLCCFDLGAPAERVRNYDKGLVIGEVDAVFALGEIRRLYESLKQKSFHIDSAL